MNAARKGSIQAPQCFVKRAPFSAEGDMIPILVPCGCTMSLAASREALQCQSCTLCNADISGDGSAECAIDRAVLRVVQAKRWGISVPSIPSSRITLGEELAQGTQVRVHEAEISGEGSGDPKSVAVKVIPVPGEVEAEDLCALQQVIATAYLASRSPHMCRMHGVSWSEKGLWCGAAATLRCCMLRDGFGCSNSCILFMLRASTRTCLQCTLQESPGHFMIVAELHCACRHVPDVQSPSCWLQ